MAFCPVQLATFPAMSGLAFSTGPAAISVMRTGQFSTSGTVYGKASASVTPWTVTMTQPRSAAEAPLARTPDRVSADPDVVA